MLTTFGATFFGVISSFLLWYVGQWWLKRKKDRIAVEHIAREIHEEITVNINILALFAEGVPKMIAEGNIPVFLPHRLNLSVHHYLTSTAELRLVDVSQQTWILSAGWISDRFNKFIDNTELLLTSTMATGLPNGLSVATHRLEGLVEQAQETAKDLTEILENLKVK